MTQKLRLTAYLNEQLEDASTSVTPKRARNAVFQQIREMHGIPGDVKLGVNRTEAARENRGVVYVKDSNPRCYIYVDDRGRYVGSAPDGAPVPGGASDATVTPQTAPVNGTPPAANGQANDRFAVVQCGDGGSGWCAISKSDLLEVLREGRNGDEVRSLPPGFPADVHNDCVVYDKVTGTIYFRD